MEPIRRNPRAPDDEPPGGARRAASGPDIPVGKQTIKISPRIAAWLAALSPAAAPHLVATGVWIGRSEGQLMVHLGDLDETALEHDERPK